MFCTTAPALPEGYALGMPNLCRKASGFTLVEMMTVLVVSAILITIAYPGFMATIRKSRRVEALDGLLRIQLEQERYRASNTGYGTLAQLGIDATTPGGFYTPVRH
jgi:type IV pilus assembly protein PilE